MVAAFKVSKSLSEVTLELKKIQNKIQRVQTDEKEAKKRVESMLKQYDWIAQERKLFGAKNSDYDFSSHDAKQAEGKLAKLQREQESLSKRINKKVMGTCKQLNIATALTCAGLRGTLI